MSNPFDTHDVTNQPPPFEDVNLFASDVALQDAFQREGGGAAREALLSFGAVTGSADALEHGRLANVHPPTLRTHDRQGRRLDVVDYHPSYHTVMGLSMGEGLHCRGWAHLAKEGGTPAPGAQVARAASLYMAAQMEAGHCCPLTMTHAAVPVLQQQPDLTDVLLPKLLNKSYDAAFVPAAEKASVTIGMGMTEKQGGTDVRSNATRAKPQGTAGPGEAYVLTGHKWFLSAPMSDAFVVLAQAEKGLSCFLVPRFLPDGSLNAIRLQRLKDKLGNRSNASSEAEFAEAHGWLIGEEGRGVAVIMDMVTFTRLDCAVSSAGLMRFAVASAVHHATHRMVSGRVLLEQPLMGQVLADLALETEAATALAFRLARSFDCASDARAAAWMRLMTPITKYWVCKVAPAVVYEAMECHGGNGYVEDAPLARIYREVPVNAIWEGSGNVMALDVLRVLQREPDVAGVVMEDLQQAAEGDEHLTVAHERIQTILQEPRLLDTRARLLVEGLALLAAGTILRAHAPSQIADAFIATRLGHVPRQTYGQGLDWADTRSILQRVTPHR